MCLCAAIRRQVAHALAQGKVGSGFDVSSAALGSQRYVRVPADTLRSYLDRLDTSDAEATLPAVTELANSRHTDWEYKVVRQASQGPAARARCCGCQARVA